MNTCSCLNLILVCIVYWQERERLPNFSQKANVRRFVPLSAKLCLARVLKRVPARSWSVCQQRLISFLAFKSFSGDAGAFAGRGLSAFTLRSKR